MLAQLDGDMNDKSISIEQLIARQANQRGSATALEAPGRAPISFEQLHEQMQMVRRQLNSWGIGANDRVAIVLPNGPEMATAFLAVGAAATAAPLNPAYRAPEFDFYLADLNAKALIVDTNSDCPAIAVAQSRSIPVIFLSVKPGDVAGRFDLSTDSKNLSTKPTDPAAPVRDDDIALVLHTSGTTSRPKIVPLSQRNICASAHNIAKALQLSHDDRCLNVMPLFHIHGLVAAVTASLSAGASVVCTPGFMAPKFFDWLGQHKPTWFTAVPTMHHAIVDRSHAHQQTIADCPLRFVRSSSSSLPPVVAQRIEEVFGVAAIEAYGMTEAAHQMCSNPLPPKSRKFGSVGIAAGPDVAVMDKQGQLLEPGTIGEVVIRGPNVTPGYEANPSANAEAFTNGWFRTGDQGKLDPEGYLFLTGRLKEIINRGGEKISPREIDEALLEHPDVAQAVTFAMPDPRLGEEIAAAVVLRDVTEADEHSLLQFATGKLAEFKIPRRIVILDAIPKGPTGKLQRIGLADKLGLGRGAGKQRDKAPYAPPRNDIESQLAEICSDVLGVERIGIHDDFFALGGDSILAAQVIARVQDKMHASLPILVFFESPTIEGMAQAFVQITQDDDKQLENMLEQLEQMSEHDARKMLKLDSGMKG